jgi:predicted site-specific integrase-resolvase
MISKLIPRRKVDETPIEELTKDIITIMNVYTAKINVYTAKINGLRKYKTEFKKVINTIKS